MMCALPEGSVLCFTGGAYPKRGPDTLGGAAAIVVLPMKSNGQVDVQYMQLESSISVPAPCTKNIAELTATLVAISRVQSYCEDKTIAPGQTVHVYTESTYVHGLLQQGWKASKNLELIQQIRSLMNSIKSSNPVVFRRCRAQCGAQGSTRARELAQSAVKGDVISRTTKLSPVTLSTTTTSVVPQPTDKSEQTSSVLQNSNVSTALNVSVATNSQFSGDTKRRSDNGQSPKLVKRRRCQKDLAKNNPDDESMSDGISDDSVSLDKPQSDMSHATEIADSQSDMTSSAHFADAGMVDHEMQDTMSGHDDSTDPNSPIVSSTRSARKQSIK